MSTRQEIEAAIPKLTSREIAELRAWLDENFEDSMELTDALKAALAEARCDIIEGRARTRQPA